MVEMERIPGSGQQDVDEFGSLHSSEIPLIITKVQETITEGTVP
jgi:hypothetical protein